jgi:D-aminopeptidase
MRAFFLSALLLLPGVAAPAEPPEAAARPRARELGIAPGIFPPGPLNAITDVAGVRVGHLTLIEGDDIRTGATAIVPHDGNLFQQKVPAAIVVGNGFGKLIGSTQVNELGQLETSILLTNTLNVWEAAAALADYTLALPGSEAVRSVNPVVGETNDGYLNNIRKRPLRGEHFLEALHKAKSGPVEEGSIGAGTGTRAFGLKGGIGTASRRLPDALGGYILGVLVQSNYGGRLTIAGVPVWKELGHRPYGDLLHPGRHGPHRRQLLPRQRRLRDCLFNRAVGQHSLQVGRTGASGAHSHRIRAQSALRRRRRSDRRGYLQFFAPGHHRTRPRRPSSNSPQG